MEIKGNIKSSSLSVANRTKVGTRFSYDWTTNPFSTWTDNTPSTTITADGTKTRFSGGTNDLSNFIQMGMVGANDYTITQRITVQAKSSTSYGIGIQIKAVTAGVPNQFIHFLLSDTTGYIAYTTTDTFPTGSDTNNDAKGNFTWTTGDVLDLSIQRRGRDMLVRMANVTNNSVSELYMSSISGGVGNLNMYFYGGTWDFTGSFVLSYDMMANPLFAVMGDSISWGSGSENVGATWFSTFSQYVHGGTVLMAAPVEQSADGVRRLADFTTWVKPKYAIVAYGVNDFLQAVGTSTFNTRLTSIVTGLQGVGIIPILLTLFPQSTDCTAYNAEVISVAAANGGLQVIDIFTLMKAAATTAPHADFLGDGVHPNWNGHLFFGNAVHQGVKSLITEPPAFTFDGVPDASMGVTRLLGIGFGGEVMRFYPGTDSGYVQNKQAINIIGDAQAASLFINGRATFTGNGTAGTSDFIVVGNSGSLANPNFKIAAGVINTQGGTLTVGQFNAGNFNVTTNSPQLTGGTFLLSGNPVFLSQSPVAYTINNPNGNGVTNAFTIDNNTADPSSATYNILRLRKFGTTVMSVARDGNVGFGASASSSFGLLLNTSGSTTAAMGLIASVSAGIGASASVLTLGSTIVEAASGTHPLLAGINISSTVVTSGSATVTNTAQIYVTGPMTATVTDANYSLWIDDGVSRLDGGVLSGSDIEITDTTKGIILTAPNASRWRITVDNAGALATTSI